MRHYYRFMELEPVMEQEEDSVGDVSPTSSTGSPSLSPPPDAWTQLSGKEYHDALSNHLLQEHLELQRAYRMLEMQYRNCDTRASRDQQRLKEVLPNQDRLRDELQRAKEREAALRGEIYDLQEQNELLEFRILELGECHENASSIRGANPETRDTGTETPCGDVRVVWPAIEQRGDQKGCEGLGHQERLTDTPQSPFTSTVQRQPISDREQRQADVDQHDSRCLTSTSQHCENAHREGRTSPDTRTNLQQCTLTPCNNHQITQNELQTSPIEQCPKDSREVSSSNSTQIDNPFSSHTLTSLSESISCTLCRTLPRRRTISSQRSLVDFETVDDDTRDRESLRKSKSDGEIQARYCSNQETCTTSIKGDSHPKGDKVLPSPSGGEQRSNTVLTNVQRFTNRCELMGTKWPGNAKCSGARLDDQVKTMRSMLTAIYEVLRETRVEVECTNSELREEVQTLETTVQRLTEEATRRAGAAASVEEPTSTRGTSAPPLVRRSRSLSFSKDCYCCSQELKPNLQDVISKLQELMDLVVDKETVSSDGSPDVSGERKRTEEASDLTDSITVKQFVPIGTVQERPEQLEGKVLEKRVTVQNKANTDISSDVEAGSNSTKRDIVEQEIQTKENVVGLHPVTEQDRTVVDGSTKKAPLCGPPTMLQRAMWKSEPLLINETQKSQEISEFAGKYSVENEMLCQVTSDDTVKKSPAFYNTDSNSCFEAPVSSPGDELDTVLKDEVDPLPEEKTKPVLRRWREQLIVRRDRVQPWRIELLDFPKRQPSVV